MAKILGLKYTHDSAVALIDGDQLVFSVEGEKINNGARYKTADKTDFAQEVLAMYGMGLDDVGMIVMDGWRHNIPIGNYEVAGYAGYDNDLAKRVGPMFFYGEHRYVSYPHVTGHIIGAYATSQFSKQLRPAISLCWDGGQIARVDVVSPMSRTPIRHIGNISLFKGYIYGIMGYYAGPFKNEDVISGKLKNSFDAPLLYDHGVPGKLMSYIGKGKPVRKLIDHAFKVYDMVESLVYGSPVDMTSYKYRGEQEHQFMKMLMGYANSNNIGDEDVLASVHQFIEELIIKRLCAIVPKGMPLVFSGGSALNIKWNTALIECGHFSEVWVPPFPNDAGSAIGAAAAEAAFEHGIWSLDWNVYSGPEIIDNGADDNYWICNEVSSRGIGEFMAHNPTEAVVILTGKAELGPRALGHRSIMMSPTTFYAKDLLNKAKKREDWRPVAPICLKDDAHEAFDLVCEDRYMLYDHHLRSGWSERIPAIQHLDNTARVQVVGDDDCNIVRDILEGFKSITGIGILCNTSANYNGKGFFPDVRSATHWASGNGINFVWCNGKLYMRKQ